MFSLLSIGSNVRNNTEQLKKVPVKYIFDAVRNPKPDIANKIRQLRIVRQLNPNKYSEIKSQLPYFVCAIFNPPFRNNANFAYTECFVIDIDHIGEKKLSIAEIKENLKKDQRVLMLFESPGGDGLKLVFHLKERCYDSGLYSIFYKDFVLKFSTMYNLQQVVDAKTSDVARACFISVDTDAYFNPNAEAVDLSNYIDIANPSLVFETKSANEKTIRNLIQSETESETLPPPPIDPDKDTIDRIKQVLEISNKKKNVEEKVVFVPEILNDIIDDLKKYITDTGVEITEITNINYGKKIKMKMGIKLAEINLFYGKRGFSVVQTPRTGTNAELNQLMSDLVESYIIQL